MKEGDIVKVKLDEKLIDYMHDHQKDVIMLKLINDDYSGYNFNTKHPRIRYHKPRHPENYDVYTVNDVTVYIEKDIETVDNNLLFTDDKIFGFHRCHVKGLELAPEKDFNRIHRPHL